MAVSLLIMIIVTVMRHGAWRDETRSNVTLSLKSTTMEELGLDFFPFSLDVISLPSTIQCKLFENEDRRFHEFPEDRRMGQDEH